jgi:hypothetical protein
MLYFRDEDFDFEAWRQSLEPPKRRAPNKPTLEMLLNLLPPTGSISKAVVLERFRDKEIGEKRARGFIDSVLSPNGPIHQWHIKRSVKRDDIHLSRELQPEPELNI